MKKIYLSFGSELTPDGYEKESVSNCFHLPDGSVNELTGMHVLDKIPDLIGFGINLYRILAPDAKATFEQIYFRHPMAWLNPRTIRGISDHTMGFLSAEWRKNQAWAISKEDLEALELIDFTLSCGFSVDPNFEHRNEEAKNFALAHYSSSIPSIRFILGKK